MDNKPKILIINPFGIGDVLFSTPLIRNIKNKFPDGKIGFLCNRRTEPIIKSNPYIDYIFVYERDEFQRIKVKSKFLWVKANIRFLNDIKGKHFDLTIDLSLNAQFGFFPGWPVLRKGLVLIIR